MLIYAGIDEAGYGPMLGPLSVGASIFAIDGVETGSGPPDLWSRLDDVVCVAARDAKRRIAVADSKKLKGSNKAKAHPLRHLERGVLSFIACRRGLADSDRGDGHHPPADDASLFDALDANLPTSARTPWYDSTTSLPVAHDAATLAIDAARLDRGLEHAGVGLIGLRGTLVDAGEFNRRLAEGAGKAAINLEVAMRLVAEIRRVARSVAPDATPRIVCDRQGGRAYYRDWLQDCFPDARIRILGETDRVSRYHLVDAEGGFVIGFETGGENRHLPVALSSMTAKYLRELAMIRLNRFFIRTAPNLRPTAGYVQDGRRFLAEIEPLIQEEGVDTAELVRRA